MADDKDPLALTAEPPGYTEQPQATTDSTTQPGHSAQLGYPAQPGYPAQSENPAKLDYPAQPGYPTQPGHSAQLGHPSQPGYPVELDYLPQPGVTGQHNFDVQYVYSAQPGYTQQPHIAQPPYQDPFPVSMPPGYSQMFQPAYQGQQSTTVCNMGYPMTNAISMPMAPPPQNWMVFSILRCLFCGWPIGLAALIFSFKVDSAYSMGDYQGAVRNSKVAFGLNIACIIVGLGCFITIFIFFTKPIYD